MDRIKNSKAKSAIEVALPAFQEYAQRLEKTVAERDATIAQLEETVREILEEFGVKVQ